MMGGEVMIVIVMMIVMKMLLYLLISFNNRWLKKNLIMLILSIKMYGYV